MTINIIDDPLILAGQSISNAVDCKTWTIVRIFVPPEWSYAPLSFMVSPDNVLPYANVCHSNGKERILEVQPNSHVLGEIIPGGWIKFRSGTTLASSAKKPVHSAWHWRFDMAIVVLKGPDYHLGESLSDALDCSAGQIVQDHVSVTWTHADITFHVFERWHRPQRHFTAQWA